MGFFDRLKNAWKIFKLSFALLKKDKSLIVIPILMIFSSLILFGIFGFLMYYYKLSSNYILFFAFLFILYFVMTFLAAAQSWMVYEVLKGKNATTISGFKRAFGNIGDILVFVFSVVFIKMLSSWLRGKGRAGQMAGSLIDYLTGLAGKLVLPAMIITERNFKESVVQLKDSLKAVPEIATYEIGIRPLMTLVFFIGLLLALMLGSSLGIFVGFIFFLILLSLMILISVYINETYYTTLYLTLIEKKKIKGLDLYIK